MHTFPQPDRDSLYRLIAARRDVRSGYTPVPLPDPTLHRILAAAHSAPSVGLMQPTRFLLLRDPATRQSVHTLFSQANAQAAQTYSGPQQDLYKSLKLEGILEAPQNLVILCDPTSPRGHTLGRQTMPETALYSTVCAIQNLWLAARAEGVGVGWVSILSPAGLRDLLQIPPHLIPVAYLCLGYVTHFEDSPELERQGWEQRLPLEQVLSYETYKDPQ